MSFVTVDIKSVFPRETYRPNIEYSYGSVSYVDRNMFFDLLYNEAQRVGLVPIHTCHYDYLTLGFKIFHDHPDGLKVGRQRLRVSFQEGVDGFEVPVLHLILSTVDKDEVVLNGMSKCKI